MRVQLKVEKLKELMAANGMSQVELARRSQISRATLVRLLGQREPWVRYSTGAKLAKALGLPERGLDPHATEAAYLDEIARQHEHLDFTGLGLAVTGSPMPMDLGFAPLSVRERRSEDGSGADCSASRQELRGVRRRPAIAPLGTALARAKRVFLLGDPGAGKTTALRHLARAYAKQKHAECGYPQGHLVPVLVRLADWAEQLAADAGTGLFAAALAQLRVPDPAQTLQWLHGKAESGDAFLLLDGLDEVADADARSRVVDGIRVFLRDHTGVRVVITSRVVGFESPAVRTDFDTLVMEPLKLDSMNKFVAAWCSFRHGHLAGQKCRQCEERVEQLRRGVVDNTRVRALAGNPLTLTILALLHEAGAALPQRRWELYEKVTEAFLFSWEEKKRQEACAALDRGLDLESRDVVWVLESLALEMQRRDWTLAPRWWLLRHVSDFLRRDLSFEPDKAAAQADTLVGSLEKRSGLLRERAPERFSFSHLAFQEYFAARATLGAADPVEALRPYFYHPRWQEVVRLASSHLDRHRVPALLRAILDDPDPTGRFIQRGLLTALACLADGAALHDPEVLQDLAERTAALGRSVWVGIAMDALGFLSELLGTRLTDFATETALRLVRTAEETLATSDVEDLCLEACSGGLLPGTDGFPLTGESERAAEADVAPARDHTVSAAGRKIPLTIVALPHTFSAEWSRRALRQLDSDPSPSLRARCATALGRFSRRKEVRTGLLDSFAREQDPQVRRAIVYSLAHAASQNEVADALLRGLEGDPVVEVASACAWALGDAARRAKSVRDKLLSVLRSHLPADVRAGAASGLSGCVPASDDVREVLLTVLRDSQEDDEVRSASLHSLEQALPSDPDAIRSVVAMLDGPPGAKLTHCVARALADGVLSGRLEWGAVLIEKAEHVLTSLKHPCCHTLEALRGLVDARELRRLGIPREARIARALAECRGRIRVMFIFGSSARGEQRADSDIDLMVIGDVTLRDLAPGLREAEHELGRPVNAVVYSKEEWRDRCTRKEPFVINVLKDRMVFIIGDSDELGAMAS